MFVVYMTVTFSLIDMGSRYPTDKFRKKIESQVNNRRGEKLTKKLDIWERTILLKILDLCKNSSLLN